jgi:hypothetical protein
MNITRFNIVIAVLLIVLINGCASIRTNVNFYTPILTDLKRGDYNLAAIKIDNAELEGEYADKDRVLLHLDKGIIYHYEGDYQRSNKELELAEQAIDDLYTKSISKAAFSILLNDNALAYSGEVYENFYINIFKAINYLKLNDYDGAYVESQRVNNKLKYYDVKLEEEVASLNSSEDKKFEIDAADLDYYNNALSHYLSHLVYRADGSFDDSRISLDKLKEAWETYPDVYNYNLPSAVTNTTSEKGVYLNVLAFAGTGPVKEPVGARITTFDDYVVISDPTDFHIQPIPIPGIKYGWNFKFEFPTLKEEGTEVYGIEVLIDGESYGELELLENMSNVARKTFESNKSVLFFKTITRAIAKGISTSALGRSIKKEAKGLFGDILVGIANAASDATENADLRSWRTMPGYSFVGEYKLEPGKHNIEIRFFGETGNLLSKKIIENYNVNAGLNLIEAVHLN